MRSCPGLLPFGFRGRLFVAAKYRRLHDLGLEGLQRLGYDPTTQGFFIFGRQLGIAEWMDDPSRRHDPIRSDHDRYRRHGRYLHCRQTRALQLFGDRCTAARAGPSGGGQNHGINASGAQLGRDFTPHAGAMRQGGGNTGGGIDRLMEFTDAPLLLQFARHIHWQQAMRILFHIGGIVAPMDVVILPWVELLLPLDAVGTVTRGGQSFDPIGIALWDESAVGDERDRGMP